MICNCKLGLVICYVSRHFMCQYVYLRIGHANEIHDLINKYVRDFMCKNELKIGAATYHILSISDIACRFTRVAGL